ncbi:hypothetical protein PGTUg99_007035 [Puccinia graminis f. sp. tritici]|uniref:Uncharacterized protein n=1 Tax=Puccinia graminis f. sp. tritici TaxID=56615 RepID=A0A5B0QYX2_PUCGR|nr:hypothetical protein PGTUg99_007035 [Puccinia graminis f. sp. tritici]
MTAGVLPPGNLQADCVGDDPPSNPGNTQIDRLRLSNPIDSILQSVSDPPRHKAISDSAPLIFACVDASDPKRLPRIKSIPSNDHYCIVPSRRKVITDSSH